MHDEYFNNVSVVSSDVAVIERLSICCSWWRILGINKHRPNGLYFDFGKQVDHLLLSTWMVIASERDYGIINSIFDISAVTLYFLWPDHQDYIQSQFWPEGEKNWHKSNVAVRSSVHSSLPQWIKCSVASQTHTTPPHPPTEYESNLANKL